MAALKGSWFDDCRGVFSMVLYEVYVLSLGDSPLCFDMLDFFEGVLERVATRSVRSLCGL